MIPQIPVLLLLECFLDVEINVRVFFSELHVGGKSRAFFLWVFKGYWELANL